MMNAAECEKYRENFHRFLDNDLSGRTATETAAHLGHCVGCRHEYERLRAVKIGLNALPIVPLPDTEKARLRAFSRLENTVRAETAAALPVGTPASERPRRERKWVTLTLMPRMGGWQPALATFAACALVGALFLVPQPDETDAGGLLPQVVPASSGTLAQGSTTAAVGASLPGASEMSVLFDLHDAQRGGLTVEDPLLHRSAVADAHASLLAHADASVTGSL